MFLEQFSLPKPDIRLITLNDTVYKIKLYLVKPPNYDPRHEQTFCSDAKNQEDIEQIIVALLTSSETLQPVKTNNLAVYPYQKKWQIADKVQFYRHDKLLKSCPHVYSFYVEPKKYIAENDVSREMEEEIMSNENAFVSNSSDNEENHSPSILDGLKFDDCMSPEKSPNSLEYVEKSPGKIELSDIENSPKKLEFSDVEKSPEKLEISDDENSPEKLQVSNVEKLPEKLECSDVEMSIGDKAEEASLSSELSDDVVLSAYQKRKRRNAISNEEKPKKMKYSVSEYLDKNRHEVQEQDLQEQLRFQELASPADEKEAYVTKESKFHQVFSSVKRLMFGSS